MSEASAPRLWRARIVLRAVELPAVEDALAEEAIALSSHQVREGGDWCLDAYCDHEPGDLAARIGRLLGTPPPEIAIERIAEQDWVRHSNQQRPPIRAGRFYVHGAHDRPPTPAGHVSLEVDAGLAFGTGFHDSTRGCLLALSELGRRFDPDRMLDLGCGSGILAMAMARLWKGRVVAADIDPIACRVTLENAARNGLRGRIAATAADGLSHPDLRRSGPYDLIVANILAAPLRRLAPEIARAAGGRAVIVLSGFLAAQEQAVAAAYLNRRFARLQRIGLGDWITLVMTRRASLDS